MLNEENQLIFVWKNLDLQLCQNVKIFRSDIIISEFIQILNDMKQTSYDLYWLQSKKLKQISAKLFYNSCSYYQLLIHILYSQSYSILTYFLWDEWSSQDYNNYWENKAQQQSSTSQISELQNNSSIISVIK